MNSPVIVKVAVIANAVKQSMTSGCMDCRASLAVTGTGSRSVCGIGPDTGGISMNSPVIANAVKQSMTSEGMDRHGLRPRDDGTGSRSVCGSGPGTVGSQ
jgi:hypothetical protein